MKALELRGTTALSCRRRGDFFVYVPDRLYRNANVMPELSRWSEKKEREQRYENKKDLLLPVGFGVIGSGAADGRHATGGSRHRL